MFWRFTGIFKGKNTFWLIEHVYNISDIHIQKLEEKNIYTYKLRRQDKDLIKPQTDLHLPKTHSRLFGVGHNKIFILLFYLILGFNTKYIININSYTFLQLSLYN